MIADLKYILLWWATYFFLGLISLPLIFKIFGSFWDKGYAFAKTIVLAILTYLILILGIFKFLPFTSTTIFCLLLVAFGLNIVYLRQDKRFSEFLTTLRHHWKIFLFEEITFLSILTIWSYARGFAPDIEGLEKYMDWGFVNSALRSQFMPPADMWFAGSYINYYYFGHLMIAVLTKLSSISSTITYNLAIASTCSLTFISAFSLTSNLVASLSRKVNFKNIIAGGLISALLLTFGGNLHTVYKIGHNIIVNKMDLRSAANSYWYPDATRFIGFDPDVNDKTIHEFPLYSFVVADLHGHMNDIPVVILFVAVLLAIIPTVAESAINWPLVVSSGFLLSVAYMTNAWDFAVYGLVFAVSSFFLSLRHYRFFNSLISTFYHGLLIIIIWYIFSLPFNLNFIPMAEGLRLSDMHTPFYQLFVLYGGFWLICLPLVLVVVHHLFKKKALPDSDFFSLALVVVATILVIIPEIGYIKDIYIFEHRRANTMFKLVYQAFMLYSLVSGYVLIRLKSSVGYKTLFFIVFLAHIIYPYFAIKSYYGLKEYKGIYGLNYLQTDYPDNFIAINWINQNISGQPVMLEAVGDSYTTFEQVSSSTGLPTIEGWIVHEWLWRGGYDAPAGRQTDVEKIYTSSDLSEVRTLLQKYNVKYIFVGDKEREKYSELDEDNFLKLGAKIVFTSGKTNIYQLP